MHYGSRQIGYGPCSVNIHETAVLTVITIIQKLLYMILKFILDNQLENARTASSIFCPISLKCHCLRKCSRGQKLWSTDLAEAWHRRWVQ